MPEGPEIRRSADGLARLLDGRKLRSVHFAFPRLKRYESMLAGRRIRFVQARGKAMLVHFSGGLSLYSHNQLYGAWSTYPGKPPATHLQERVILTTAAGTAVLYSASDIEVIPSDVLHTHPYLAKLGPDLLDDAATTATVFKRLGEPAYAGRRLSSLLLDQGVLAGIGNYLRSEILFAARLHPDWRLDQLAPAEVRRLALHALGLTRRAYRSAGVTNNAALARRLRASGAAFEEYRYAVFERASRPCYVCGKPILRIERNRSIYLCPHCQPAPPGKRA
jgi:endonuclease-8